MLARFRYFVAGLLLWVPVSQSLAQAQTSSYEELQAAYLYNFAKYIKWPVQPPVFIIGVYGEDSGMISVLKRTLRGKTVAGRAMEIRSVITSGEAGECQILYFSHEENHALSEVIEFLSGTDILIVTEEDMIRKGAMISFVVEAERLRFKLKKEALEKAGLSASEGLLRLSIQL